MNGVQLGIGRACVLATAFIFVNSSSAQSGGYTITERGPDWKVMQKTEVVNGITNVHRYTELATGMHYTNASGQLVESKEQITILPNGGAAATQGRHKAYFPSDIYNGVLEVITPDGRHLKSRPLGVSYDDGSNTVFIATLKHAQGYLTSSNQVTYRDAFDGIKADLVATYRRSGFECDLVFREQPPTPGDYGLDEEWSTLQMVTEFFNTADPVQIPAASDEWFGLQDSTLKFGNLTMKQGKAFAIKTTNSQSSAIRSQRDSVPVYKRWLKLDGRKFLIEELPLEDLAEDLNALPLTAKAVPQTPDAKSKTLFASGRRQFPPAHEFIADTNQILLAKADFSQEPGMVLDYVTVDSGQTDFTFQSDTTYYVMGNVYLDGTTTFEAGAVIKGCGDIHGGQTCISVSGPISCPSDTAKPVIFTAINDDSVGNILPESNGTPLLHGNLAYLAFDSGTITNVLLQNMRFYYGGVSSVVPLEIWSCQFINIGCAISAGSDLQLRNVLFHRNAEDDCVDAAIWFTQGSLVAENVTVNHVAFAEWGWWGSGPASFTLVNCLTTERSRYSSDNEYNINYYYDPPTIYATNFVWVQEPQTPVFQTAANARFYLVTNSPYRNAGTTNINPDLLADLQTMTTYAPQDGGMPDTNAPDLGYHYPVNEDSDYDGLADWWEWHWFGSYNLSGSDLDSFFRTLLSDYQNGIDPDKLSNTMVVDWLDDLEGLNDPPHGLTNAISLSAGEWHSLALKNDGTVVAWGDNEFGQTDVPVNLTNVVSVCAGYINSIAVKNDGTVVAWGTNFYGGVLAPDGLTGVKAVVAGWEHTIALRTNGTLVAWGINSSGQTNVPADLTNVIAIAACANHSLALKNNGTVVGWGANWHNAIITPPGLSNVVSIAAGIYHSVALKNDGTVVAWGDNSFGQTDVPANLTNVIAIAACWWHSVALKSDGTVVVWGDEEGLEPSPVDPLDSAIVPVDGLNRVVAISAARLYALALRSGPASPVITKEPVDQYQIMGGEVTFTVKGVGLYGVTYQWQSNGMNIAGATNAALTLTNVQSVQFGVNYRVVVADNAGMGSLVSSNATVLLLPAPIILSQSPFPTNQIVYHLTNVTLNVVATAPRIYTGFPLSYQWQFNGVNLSGATGPTYSFPATANATGVYSVLVSNAAGSTNAAWQVTVVATNGIQILQQPTNQYQIAGGTISFYGAGVSSNAVTYQWQFNGTNLSGATNAALTITNVSVANEGSYNFILGDSIDSRVSSNATFYLVTPPQITSQSEPTNQTVIEGKYFSFAATAAAPYQTNGFPLSYRWQLNGTNLPGANGTNYSAYASDGQAGTFSLIASNLAGIASVSWQVTLTNAINVTNDLLLIYNTNSPDSIFVKDYYLAHRPNVGGANVLGVGCPGIFITNKAGTSYYYAITNTTVYETVTAGDFTNQVLVPVLNWLTNNPTKRPQYVIMMLDVPSRIDESANSPSNYPFYTGGAASSISYLLTMATPTWKPFVTHLNMNGTNDCIAYINKLATLGTLLASNSPLLSASAGGYGNTNYILDNVRHGPNNSLQVTGEFDYSGSASTVSNAITGLTASGVSTNAIHYLDDLDLVYTNTTPFTYVNVPQITNGVNVAGYISWGIHSGLGGNYAINGGVKWTGNSGWWIVETAESYNGQRYSLDFGTFIKWFSPNAFGGTSYANTPVGAVSHVDEPSLPGVNDASIYFGLWADGKNFAICAWNSKPQIMRKFQAIGDPFIVR